MSATEPTPEPMPDQGPPQPDPDTDTETSDDDDTNDDEDDLPNESEEVQREEERFSPERTDESERERKDSDDEESERSEPARFETLPEAPSSPLSYDELNDMADNGELTEQSLQATLNSYAQAIKEEYEQTLAAESDLSNVEGYTRDFFKKNVHSAAAQIVWLANNAESESVKLKAATTVIHEALADARADGDPIKLLLAELTATPADPINKP